jgi:hypothetical protein
MLSQLGYLGCIVKPKAEQMTQLKEIIYGYIKGSLNISRDKIITNAKDGGLGMINIEHYLTALQAAWFKKINNAIIDNWRRFIFDATTGDILTAKKKQCKAIMPR